MSELPRIACLCPTFRRPARLVENSIACYLAQTYPADRRRLLILDDAGDLTPQAGDGWEVVSLPERLPTLPEKYHRLVALAAERYGPDAYCVWEDDDVYLPDHLARHAYSLAACPWSHPSTAWALTTGQAVQESTVGRLHAALAFTARAYRETGGWPRTRRPDFDLQLLALLRRRYGPPVDPPGPPSYVFRWASTGHPHAQNFMRSADDDDWYSRAAASIPPIPGPPRMLVPRFDGETASLVAATWDGTHV